ncbi:ribonuclease P protein subunit p20 [Copidosoma floridanum]|uniref:ribonuclease P protein subunit p20 n=1 Tax=Copidosoma floridanum TaxID=29053 RepID=UPI0006C97639|nr:ribonuclease P protein subunit p20 [Copidosoma floridanum]
MSGSLKNIVTLQLETYLTFTLTTRMEDDNRTETGLEQKSAKTTNDEKRKAKRKTVDDSHVVRKRVPDKVSQRNKDVYVNNNTDFKALLKKCEKVLASEAKEVILHGLGGAIIKTCNLALKLQRIHHGTLQLYVKTSSVALTDDLEPKTDDADYEVNNRCNSAIHIRVFRTALIGALRF